MLKKPVMKRLPIVPLLMLLAGFLFVISACTKEYSLEVNKTLAAQGSLQDSLGNCLEDSVIGTYYGGVQPGRDTAYVEVKVNVTSAGSYAIYSNTQDGIYFSDSGYFTTTGINTIKLKPVGTPIIPGGPYDFNISFDSTTCYFTLNVQDSTGTGLGGHDKPDTTGGGGTDTTNLGTDTWRFTSPAGTFSGTTYAQIASANGVTILSISGSTVTGDSVMGIAIGLPNTTVPSSGIYKTTNITTEFQFSNPTGFIYEADITTSGVEMTITITSYDSATHELKGTFSGTAKGPSGKTNITNGSFDALVH